MRKLRCFTNVSFRSLAFSSGWLPGATRRLQSHGLWFPPALQTLSSPFADEEMEAQRVHVARKSKNGDLKPGQLALKGSTPAASPYSSASEAPPRPPSAAQWASLQSSQVDPDSTSESLNRARASEPGCDIRSHEPPFYTISAHDSADCEGNW